LLLAASTAAVVLSTTEMNAGEMFWSAVIG
jgi:hypothetical protein